MTDPTRHVVMALKAAGIAAFSEVPATRPARFATVMRTGGGRRGRCMKDAAFSIDCWSETRRDAAELCEAVEDAVLSLPETDEAAFHAAVETVYYNPDPDSGAPRYCANVAVSFCD